MKTLILIRHAKSSHSVSGLRDFDRPLNERGQHDAPRIGAFLRTKGIQPDHIYSSPANRAISTARLIAHELGFPLENIEESLDLYTFEDGLSDIVCLVENSPDNAKTVLLFGHNDTFTYLANHFTQHRLDNLPTCGVVCFQFDADTWRNFDQSPATLEFMMFPKELPV